jgi:hypothetical protein
MNKKESKITEFSQWKWNIEQDKKHQNITNEEWASEFI